MKKKLLHMENCKSGNDVVIKALIMLLLDVRLMMMMVMIVAMREMIMIGIMMIMMIINITF